MSLSSSDDEELLQEQVVMSTNASLGQTVWVYRGSMWGASSGAAKSPQLALGCMHWLCVSAAYPWYTSVRKTLEDPAYADWYIKFKPVGPYYSNKVRLSCRDTRCTC